MSNKINNDLPKIEAITSIHNNDDKKKWQLPLPETFLEKLVRKCKADPLVPFGITLTTIALTGGLTSFGMNKRHLYQGFMWGRIYAQGFTVCVLAFGAYYRYSQSSNNNNNSITANIQQSSYLNNIKEGEEERKE